VAAGGGGAWIERNLGEDYAWPGNFRELEQCVRNVLLRGAYRPTGAAAGGAAQAAGPEWLREAARGGLTVDQMLGHYMQLVLERAGSLEAAAERLGVDPRTVRARLPVERRRARKNPRR
jgi:transcriptional regulator with GAF, ATPase, and Fis domain